MAKKKESAQDKLVNIQAASLAAQVANWAAQLEFQKERMRLLELPQFQFMSQLEIDRLAFQKAEAEHKRALEEASLTGTYKGQPTMQYLEQQARLFGVIDGQQTLEGKLTEAQIAQMNHAMEIQTKQLLLEDEKFGFERERWGAEFSYQMQKDIRDYELTKAGVTGYYGGQRTLEREQMEGQQANQYLSLMASLQTNPFKAARVLANTPQGLQSVTDAWLGKFDIAGQSAAGAGPGAPQMRDLITQFDPNTGLPIQQPGIYFQQPQTTPQGFNDPYAQVPTPHPYSQMQPVGEVSGPYGSFGYNDERSYYEATRLASGLAPMLPGYYQQQATGQTPAQIQSPAQPMPVGTMPVGAPGTGTVPRTYGDAEVAGGFNRYQLPAGTGQTPAPAMQPDNAQVPGYSLDAQQGYTVSPPGTGAPTYAYNYMATPSGQTQVYPPGIQAPAAGVQVSTTTPLTASQQSSINPGKINARNYANTNQFMKDLKWMQIEEEQGIPRAMAEDIFRRSLPKYGGPKTGQVLMAGA